MNFTDLESTWRSPHNRPSADELGQQKMHFITDLRRRRRGNLLFLALSGLPLAIFTVLVVRHVGWPDPAHTPVDLRREWALIPLYLLPWAGWFFIVRLHFRQWTKHRCFDRSIHASVAALLDENRSERTRYKLIGGLLLASIPILWLIMLQLRAVGKAGDEIFLPFLVFFPALLLGIGSWMLVHYRRKLVPRGRELATLLGSYRSAEGAPPEQG